MRSLLVATVLCGALGCVSARSGEVSSRKVVLLPPRAGVYVAAFPDLGGAEDVVETGRIKAFEEAVGKPVAWVYFSNNWWDGIRFPRKDVETICAAGSVPFIRLMARSQGAPRSAADPVYNMQAIVSGTFDNDLRQWARDARDVGRPLLAEFGTEVNGSWFPWNGEWNGGRRADGYGDPAAPDGPERFRDAFRHIIDISREEGAWNIVWFMHVDAAHAPDEPWNNMAAYYPGDDYIDWIGISTYGSQRPGREWIDFNEKLGAAYKEFESISATKPLAILEYGAVEDPAHDKAAWIREALGAIRAGSGPRVKAVSYWNEAWTLRDGTRIDLRANSSPATLAAYREAIADPFFVPRLEFAAKPVEGR